MSHFSNACQPFQFTDSSSQSRVAAEPGLIGRRALPVLAAVAFVAALATVPHSRPAAIMAPAQTSQIVLHDPNLIVLRDKAEAMRAQLLRTPGTRAVTITGLRQQRLEVDYTRDHLASFGITQSDLAASLPVDQALSRPGHLALQAKSGPDSMQDVANTPVRAGARVFRLGDVALVSRAPLDPPVSTMNVAGEPAVQLNVAMTR